MIPACHFARQSPFVIELMYPEHCPNRLQLGGPGTFRNAERFVNGRKRHVRCLARVVKEIDPADGSHDSRGPGLQLA